MVGRIDNQQDRYGRDLRALRRTRPDGTVQSIAEEIRFLDKLIDELAKGKAMEKILHA